MSKSYISRRDQDALGDAYRRGREGYRMDVLRKTVTPNPFLPGTKMHAEYARGRQDENAAALSEMPHDIEMVSDWRWGAG